MDNQYGFITKTDKHEVQNITVDAQLGGFLSQMHFTAQGEFDFPRDVSGLFLTASPRRSHILMYYRYRQYASLVKGASYLLPVFGVKGGVADIGRATNYTHLIVTDENSLKGNSFFNRIFGSLYMTAEDSVTLTESRFQAFFDQSPAKVECRVEPEELETVVRIVEKLWEAQEKSPESRFVIQMKDAASRSMDLLKKVLLLLPQKLRLQIGFETNIAKEDLALVQEAGLPLYLFTMDSDEAQELSGFRFPVVVYDLEKTENYTYNSFRLELLRLLAGTINEVAVTCLTFAEEVVIDKQADSASISRASSFKLYEEIIRTYLNDETYWWNKKTLSSVGDLCGEIKRQKELMAVPELHDTALCGFWKTIVPQSGLSGQMLDLILDKDTEDRSEQLTILQDELYLEKPIQAVEILGERFKAEKEKAVSEASETLAKQHREQTVKMQKDADNALSEQKKETEKQRRQSDKLSKELAEEQKNKDRLKTDIDRLKVETGELSKKLKKAEDRLKQANVQRVEQLETELEDTKKKLRRKKEDAEDASQTSTRLKILTGIFAGGMAVAVVAAAVLGIKYSGLHKVNIALESEKNALEEKHVQVEESLETGLSETEADAISVGSVETESESPVTVAGREETVSTESEPGDETETDSENVSNIHITTDLSEISESETSVETESETKAQTETGSEIEERQLTGKIHGDGTTSIVYEEREIPLN